jgi:hypothetical protein
LGVIKNICLDLFQKVVAMAGTACCDFALNSAEHVKEACLDYAIRLGFQPLDNGKAEYSPYNAYYHPYMGR